MGASDPRDSVASLGGYERIYLKRPQWEFASHGQSGTEVSTLFPHVATCVDDIALIRSRQRARCQCATARGCESAAHGIKSFTGSEPSASKITAFERGLSSTHAFL